METYPDGSTYQGAFLADQRHGPGTFTSASQVPSSLASFGVFFWLDTYLDGSTYQGAFLADQCHGPGAFTSASQVPSSPAFFSCFFSRFFSRSFFTVLGRRLSTVTPRDFLCLGLRVRVASCVQTLVPVSTRLHIGAKAPSSNP